jgi:hypothetical protein
LPTKSDVFFISCPVCQKKAVIGGIPADGALVQAMKSRVRHPANFSSGGRLSQFFQDYLSALGEKSS